MSKVKSQKVGRTTVPVLQPKSTLKGRLLQQCHSLHQNQICISCQCQCLRRCQFKTMIARNCFLTSFPESWGNGKQNEKWPKLEDPWNPRWQSFTLPAAATYHGLFSFYYIGEHLWSPSWPRSFTPAVAHYRLFYHTSNRQIKRRAAIFDEKDTHVNPNPGNQTTLISKKYVYAPWPPLCDWASLERANYSAAAKGGISTWFCCVCFKLANIYWPLTFHETFRNPSCCIPCKMYTFAKYIFILRRFDRSGSTSFITKRI